MPIQIEDNLPVSGNTILLTDGSSVGIRPIHPSDGVKIQGFVSRLSPESRYLRFLEYINGITSDQADRLATVDTHSQMAFAATRSTPEGEEIIGIARYAVFDLSRPERAEVGVVVEDRFQGQGIATGLFNQLIGHARREGIRILTGTIHPTNELILKIIEDSGFPVERRFNSGLWDVEIDIH